MIYRVRTVEISLTSIDVNGFQWPSDRKQIFRVDGPNVCPSSAVENQAFGSYVVFIDQPVVLTTFVSATRSPNFPNGDWKAGANEPLTFEILEGAVKGVTAESCKRANGSLKYAHDVHYRNPNEDAYGEVPDDHAITCKLTVR